MFQCPQCFKKLSSKQSLVYHQNSSQCGSTEPTVVYKRECDIWIECSTNGIILDVNVKGTSSVYRKYYNNRDMSGTNIYDHIDPIEQYPVSRSHIDCLSFSTLQRLKLTTPKCSECFTEFVCLMLTYKNKLYMFHYIVN